MHHNDPTKKIRAIREEGDKRTTIATPHCTRCKCPILASQPRQQTADGFSHLNHLDCRRTIR